MLVDVLCSIIEVNLDETLLVEYVDYGNTETLTFNEIKKIPPVYLELPKQVNTFYC